ncbi:NAD-dependent epimerase/dehydratase family protein [Actinomyces weissii]|uniref:NAD(P)-dependent oxidoreductase n=1 Tax=Actinomyces weissii TaxID=675090 RepID=A0A7T7S2Q6_9ACTO|nr:NAD(P)-dependent oxidoreductase [Actinomyces weissii]QQM67935.1 NAD(P)-dependent oxidoreductase [Actinomyces weissii]
MLEKVLAAPVHDLPYANLRGCRLLVIGATGFIGRHVLESLYAIERKHSLGIRVVCTVRDERRARAMFARFDRTLALEYVNWHLLGGGLAVAGTIDALFHLAAVTNSAAMVEQPASLAREALIGAFSVFDLAADKKARVIYASSMEAYGAVNDTNPRKENELGHIDLTKPRSAYPETKRMIENILSCYEAQFDMPFAVVRLGQTFGPGASLSDHRAIYSFVRQAAAGLPITLATSGASRTNLLYVSDAVDAMIRCLVNGDRSGTYNVSDPSGSMSVLELAHLIDGTLKGNGVQVKVDPRVNAKYAAETRLVMETSRIQAIGWRPRTSIVEGIQRTARDLHGRALEAGLEW